MGKRFNLKFKFASFYGVMAACLVRTNLLVNNLLQRWLFKMVSCLIVPLIYKNSALRDFTA